MVQVKYRTIKGSKIILNVIVYYFPALSVPLSVQSHRCCVTVLADAQDDACLGL